MQNLQQTIITILKDTVIVTRSIYYKILELDFSFQFIIIKGKIIPIWKNYNSDYSLLEF